MSSLLESRLALRIKHSYKKQARAYRISWELKDTIGRRRWYIATQERKVYDDEIEIHKIWFIILVQSPFLVLACGPIVETRFLELARSLLDVSTLPTFWVSVFNF